MQHINTKATKAVLSISEGGSALIPKSITSIHKTALNVLFTKLHLQPAWWNHYKTTQEAQKTFDSSMRFKYK